MKRSTVSYKSTPIEGLPNSRDVNSERYPRECQKAASTFLPPIDPLLQRFDGASRWAVSIGLRSDHGKGT